MFIFEHDMKKIWWAWKEEFFYLIVILLKIFNYQSECFKNYNPCKQIIASYCQNLLTYLPKLS
jgi:hypothetical protein